MGSHRVGHDRSDLAAAAAAAGGVEDNAQREPGGWRGEPAGVLF